MVPGGQQIFVAPSGAIGYTAAHSMSMPVGAFVGGFTASNISSNYGPPQTILTWVTPGSESCKRQTRSIFLRGTVNQ
jgi:hypothetical protein